MGVGGNSCVRVGGGGGATVVCGWATVVCVGGGGGQQLRGGGGKQLCVCGGGGGGGQQLCWEVGANQQQRIPVPQKPRLLPRTCAARGQVIALGLYTVQQALRVKCHVFGVFVCFAELQVVAG